MSPTGLLAELKELGATGIEVAATPKSLSDLLGSDARLVERLDMAIAVLDAERVNRQQLRDILYEMREDLSGGGALEEEEDEAVH